MSVTDGSTTSSDGPPAEELARPWADQTRSLLRDNVLRATDELLAQERWKAVTIAQVAAAAGVSRQTVYNEFGNRQDLARAYAAWAGDQLLDEVERCVGDHRDDLHGALHAAFSVFLEHGATHPLIRSLRDRTGSDDLVASLATPEGAPIVVGAVDRLSTIICTTWPALPSDVVATVSEVLVRVAISHLLHPTASTEAAADQMAVVLGPLIGVITELHLA